MQIFVIVLFQQFIGALKIYLFKVKVVKFFILFIEVTGLTNSQIVPHCLVQEALDKNHKNRLQDFWNLVETHISNPYVVFFSCLSG